MAEQEQVIADASSDVSSLDTNGDASVPEQRLGEGDEVVVATFEEVNEVVRQLEIGTVTKFVVRSRMKTFGSAEWKANPDQKVYWRKPASKGTCSIPFDGVPFMMVGVQYMACHQGPDMCKYQKRKHAEKIAKLEREDHCILKRKRLVQDTKKLGCPAKIGINQIAKFPDFAVNVQEKETNQSMVNSLKRALSENPETVKMKMEYHIKLPGLSSHEGHPVSNPAAGQRELIDQRVRDKVKSLLEDGVRTVPELQRHVQAYVVNVLFQGKPTPSRTRRRFYPTDTDISNMITLWKKTQCHADTDQENLAHHIHQWQEENPNDFYYYRPHIVGADKALDVPMLLCVQTEWQSRLLNLYGNQMCLLDATYKTTKYRLPLFFLCVRTNVSYTVVGAFVIEAEDTSHITEALQIFKKWNSSWEPQNFMVDFSVPNMNALQNVWPETHIRICDFHRERAWHQKCCKLFGNLSGVKEQVLTLLRNIAHAPTVSIMQRFIQTLENSRPWKNVNRLRTWFDNKWRPKIKSWACAYDDEDLAFVIRTNNGIERQNKTLKHRYLHGYKNCSLHEMVTVLVDKFFPDYYGKYLQKNTRYAATYRKYTEQMPTFLHNRPGYIARHIMQRWGTAIEVQSVKKVSSNTFTVKSEGNANHEYTVSFGSSQIMPKCTCTDWHCHRMPCKHFCAIFKHISGWSWDQLPTKYKENPIFSLDPMCQAERTAKASDSICDMDGEKMPQKTSDQHSSSPTMDTSIPCTLSSETDDSEYWQMMHQLASLFKQGQDLTYDQPSKEFIKCITPKVKEIVDVMKDQVPKDKGMQLSLSSKKRKASGLGEFQRRKRKRYNDAVVQTSQVVDIDKSDMEVQTSQQTVIEPNVSNNNSATTHEKANAELGSTNQEIDYSNVFPEIGEKPVHEDVESKRTSIKDLRRGRLSTKKYKTGNRVGQVADMKREHVGVKLPITEPASVPCNEKNANSEPFHCEVRGICLKQPDEDTIKNNGELDDRIINVSQYLLAEQFPALSGMTDTVAIEHLDKCRKNLTQFGSEEKIIQIHFVPGHWLMSTSIGGSIRVYDSMPAGHYTALIKQLREIYKSYARDDGKIDIKIICAQRQSGGTACGLFAIANCVALAYGFAPEKIQFYQSEMADHLVECLGKKKMSMFPHRQKLKPNIYEEMSMTI